MALLATSPWHLDNICSSNPVHLSHLVAHLLLLLPTHLLRHLAERYYNLKDSLLSHLHLVTGTVLHLLLLVRLQDRNGTLATTCLTTCTP